MEKNQKENTTKLPMIDGTPLKINMEHNHGGLEDDFPFQKGDF